MRRNSAGVLLAVSLSLALLLAPGCGRVEQTQADPDPSPPTGPQAPADPPAKEAPAEPGDKGDDREKPAWQSVGDLAIGDRVMDRSWEWEYRDGENYLDGATGTSPVVWIVVAKNHYEILDEEARPIAHVTLLAEDLIGRYAFDDSTNRTLYSTTLYTPGTMGSNTWEDSGTSNAQFGVRRFLNGTYEDEDHPHHNVSFAGAFSAEFAGAVLETELANMKTHSREGHVLDTATTYYSLDRVFLPSYVELGMTPFTGGDPLPVGTVFPYFDVDSEFGPDDWQSLRSRLESAQSARLQSSSTRRWSTPGYWTRQPRTITDWDLTINFYLERIGGEGHGIDNRARMSRLGVRPAVNVTWDTRVSVEPKGSTRHHYEILWEGR